MCVACDQIDYFLNDYNLYNKEEKMLTNFVIYIWV